MSREENSEIPEKNMGNQKPHGKKKRAGIIFICLITITGAVLLSWWLKNIGRESTDNAFVEAHLHSVAAKISGRIATIAVKDNQLVHKGDLLFIIDPADYRAKVAAAAAALDATLNETSGDYAKIDQARAELQQSRAKLEQADSDLKRGKALFAKDVIPREQLERLETAAKIATAQVAEKEENLKRSQAEAGLSASGNRDAKAAQKKALLTEAELSLDYTRVTAPADGYITRKSIEEGNFVQTGQPALVVVALENAWVTANFKESQLAGIKPGQRVELKVDAYPGRTFTGKVDSIMAGTGSAFSLLPPENATGNYVKVVQRIPVRIAIEQGSDPEHLLRSGMSVVPTVFTGRTFKDLHLFN